MEHGKAHAAEALLRQAALTVGQQKGVLDPDAVALRANLAFAIDAQKRYAETEPLYRLLLRDARKVFGAHHPYTLTIENNLAYVLNKLDRAVEAESLYRDVYQARREVLGAQHYATLISLNNLAVQLRRLGQFAQSEPLQRQAYEGLQKTIGVHDPRSVQTGLNVVQDLIPQGKFEAAQHLLESLLGDVRQHGKQQVVALALRLFGQSLQGQGKLDAAEQSYEQSWQAAKAIKNTDEQRETAQAAANLHDKAGAGAAKSTIWQQRLQELSSRPGETPKPAKADS